MKISYYDYINEEDALDYILTEGHISSNADWHGDKYIINKEGLLVYVQKGERKQVPISFLFKQDNKFWFKGKIELESPDETFECPVMKFAELQGEVNDLKRELNHLYNLLEERGVL